MRLYIDFYGQERQDCGEDIKINISESQPSEGRRDTLCIIIIIKGHSLRRACLQPVIRYA